MPTHRPANRAYLWWSLPVLVSLALVVVVAMRHHRPEPRPRDDGIVVVDARDDAALPIPMRAAPPPATADVEPRDAAGHVARQYSVLSDVSLECAGDRCTFRATIRPPRGQADLDQRQQMLLGGLAATLAEDGYTLVVPFRMVEVDDNLFRLEAAATPPGG